MDKYDEICQLPALQFFRLKYQITVKNKPYAHFPCYLCIFRIYLSFVNGKTFRFRLEIRTPIYQYAIYHSHANSLSDGYCRECYTATNELSTELTRWAGEWGDHPPIVWRRTNGVVLVGDVYLKPYSPQADERKKKLAFSITTTTLVHTRNHLIFCLTWQKKNARLTYNAAFVIHQELYQSFILKLWWITSQYLFGTQDAKLIWQTKKKAQRLECFELAYFRIGMIKAINAHAVIF